MSEYFRGDWINRTRKVHRCGWCGRKIEQGARAHYSCGKFDGDFWSQHMHPECYHATRSMSYDDLAEGWYPGEHARGRTDDMHDARPMFDVDGARIEAQLTTKGAEDAR